MKVDAPVIALQHVTVIDGTGAAPQIDQTIILRDGTIASIGASASVSIPAGAQVMDLTGYSVIPGLVGMHEHMFYPAYGPVPMYNELGTSAPRLYLACGVTTARTTGSVEPYTDLNLKRMIDDGRMVGPKMNVTGPYLEGAGAYTPQMHELASADEARKMVDYWNGLGAGSFKAYMHITHDELAAAIDESHKRGVKLTGHLCSIGFKEAAALGIDNLEHGLVVDTEFDPSKKPDTCPSQTETYRTLAKMDVEGAGNSADDSRARRASRGSYFHARNLRNFCAESSAAARARDGNAAARRAHSISEEPRAHRGKYGRLRGIHLLQN